VVYSVQRRWESISRNSDNGDDEEDGFDAPEDEEVEEEKVPEEEAETGTGDEEKESGDEDEVEPEKVEDEDDEETEDEPESVGDDEESPVEEDTDTEGDEGEAPPSEAGSETPSEEDESRLDRLLSTLGRYAADHTAHMLVVAFLGFYPGIHHVVTNSFPPAEFIIPPVGVMIAVFYFGLFAVSFDFISGYTGYLSLGHAAFYGIGAYTVLMVANGLVPFVPSDTLFMASLVIAGAISVVLALVIGLVSFRLRGFYFAMITLGFTQVMYVFMRRWSYPVGEGRDPASGISAAADVPGFEIGIPFIDVVNLDFSNSMLAIGRIQGDEVSSLFGLGIPLSSETVSYYVIGAVVLICYLVLQRIIHSPFGSVMIAIRENEERARALGYNVFAYKLAAFSISAFFAAVAGGLFAGYRRTVSPDETFFFMRSADAILASVIGGFGTLAGPIYGRLIQGGVENFLNEAPFVPSMFADHDLLFLGIIFILFVLYLPTGIVGWVRARLGGKVAEVVGGKVSNYFKNF